MGALNEALQDPTKRRAIVDDGVAVIEAEVASKRGLTGAAVKTAFKAVKKLKPGFINMALNHLMDDFAAQLDPFYDQWKASGSGTLEQHFRSNAGAIANALLSVTDARAQNADNRVVKKSYSTLRPQAVNHLTEAMPRLAGLVSRHVS